MIRVLAALVLLLFAALPAAAQTAAPRVRVRLIGETATVAPGAHLAVAFEQDIAAGWHTYWRNPGAAGMPTTLAWSLPAGWQAGPLQWPYPERLATGPLIDYGYQHKVWLLTQISVPQSARPGETVRLKAHAAWLVCKQICIPEDAALTLPVTIAATTAQPYATTAADFAAARARLPAASPWPVTYGRHGSQLVLFVAAPKLAAARPQAAMFFPAGGDEIVATAPQTLRITATGLALQLQASAQHKALLEGVLELTDAHGAVQALDIRAHPGPVPEAAYAQRSGLSLGWAMLFAMIGGLILNLMPCVLPILAIKALAIAQTAHDHRARAARQGLSYGLGSVLGFVALGATAALLRAGGTQVGWGFQLQRPVIVAGFALLLFAVGLNLSGILEWSAGFGGGDRLTRRGGTWGAFFTGLLAVAVAAPCTAPFMAAALGYALTQSAPAAMLVFTALGIGFAAPFVAIAFLPVLLKWLPRPGPWMVRLREGLAFPMYGASAWLLWVLTQEAGASALLASLGAMVLLAFAAWVYGASRWASEGWRRLGLMLGAVALAASLSALALVDGAGAGAEPRTAQLAARDLGAQAYDPARLARLRQAGRPVFVDATAAWCITCMVNEKLALEATSVRQAFRRRRVAYLVADWTNRDPQITALLAAHGRVGVPLYLYYPPGATRARVLPQILTAGDLLSVLGAPAGSGGATSGL